MILGWLGTAVLIAAPAFAAWQDYSYPELGFLVTFPAEPKVETGTYRAADGSMLPDRVFTVEQDGLVFRITVVDCSSTTTKKADVIKAAVNDYLKRGELVEDTFARIDNEFGRNLNIAGKVAELDRSKTILVNCHAGSRGAIASAELARLGFKTVCNLEGGLDAWETKCIDRRLFPGNASA